MDLSGFCKRSWENNFTASYILQNEQVGFCLKNLRKKIDHYSYWNLLVDDETEIFFLFLHFMSQNDRFWAARANMEH